MNSNARSLPVLLLLAPLALAAAPDAALAAALWTESGDVTIMARTPGGTFYGLEAQDVTDSDILHQIDVGDGGTLAQQQSGSLFISGEGTLAVARDLADVFVLVGDLDLNDCHVDGNIRIGSTIDTASTDPSVGSMSVMLSDFDGDVIVRNGTLTCQSSTIHSISVLDAGYAQIAGCVIEAITGSGLSETSISGSTVTAASPSFHGTTSVSNTTIDSSSGTILEGDISIGLSGPVDWDNSAAITVGQNTHTTHLVVNDSSITTQTTNFRGGGVTDVTLQGATTWLSFGLVQVQSGSTTVDVSSASQLDARSNLWISAGAVVTVGSGVGTDSRIDVGGDLGLGNVDEDTFSSGTLTIEDGGVVDVQGTLYIRPLATLNLNGGTLRVTNLVQDPGGTLNENGGTLIVPEAGGSASAIAAMLVLALRAARKTTRGGTGRQP